MKKINGKRWLWGLGIVAGLWLGVRYLLPVLIPFILGGLLALAAEPLVRWASKRMKRTWAAGLGVTATLVLFVCVLTLVGTLAVKELSVLSQKLPQVQSAVQSGVVRLHHWANDAVQHAPAGIRDTLQQTVDGAFSADSTLLQPVAEQIPRKVTGFLLWIPRATVLLFTSLVSAFMISGRLPRIKAKILSWLPESFREKYLPAVKRVKQGMGGWMKAQLKLMLLTWAIVSAGLVLLRVDNGIFVAALVALVDAVPVLGTGTVLIPWAAISFLQGSRALAFGLLGLYGVALTVRTALEPRIIGRQLGLDPLLTLIAFYTGFTLWGIGGMLLAPLLAAALSAILHPETQTKI